MSTEAIAQVLAKHRPVFGAAFGCTFPTRCGECDEAVPGWAAWDRHLADALAARVELAWDEGHRDVCTDCCCPPIRNPYRRHQGRP